MSTFIEKLIYVLETTGEKIAKAFDTPGIPCGCGRHIEYNPPTCEHPSWEKRYNYSGTYYLRCAKCKEPHPNGRVYPKDGGKNYE